jgi:hypothetical protein
MTVNVFDIVFAIAFVGIVGLGFMGGVIRLGFTLVSLYLGVIVATYFYLAVGTAMSNAISDLAPFTATVVSFFALLSAATAALVATLLRTFGTLRLPRRLASLDQIGGSALGVVTATFCIVVVVLVLGFFFRLMQQAADAGVNVWPLALMLGGQLRLSFLARFFVELGQPLFVLVVPWFPNGLPVILTSVV